MVRDCHEGAKGSTKVEFNSTLIASTERQVERLSVNLDEESRLHFKRGHHVLKSLSCRMLVPEGGFEVAFSMISPGRKGLVYLKTQVSGFNVTILIDIGARDSFLTPECAKRLEVVVEDMALPVKVNFAQGLCQAV